MHKENIYPMTNNRLANSNQISMCKHIYTGKLKLNFIKRYSEDFIKLPAAIVFAKYITAFIK